MLNHILDHLVDYSIIGLVTTALYLDRTLFYQHKPFWKDIFIYLNKQRLQEELLINQLFSRSSINELRRVNSRFIRKPLKKL